MSRESTNRRITIFGGSRCGPEAEEYKEALKLGRLLVEARFDVCSGGYSGIMEAISRGAHEAGGHVIGVTMKQFDAEPNRYLGKILPSVDFYARLQTMIRESEGYIALRGGIGTLTEISLVWNKLMTGVIPKRPLVLLGDSWPGLISSLGNHLVVSERDLSHLIFAPDADHAVRTLQKSIGTPDR